MGLGLVEIAAGVRTQNATNIALTKLDILSYMDRIPVCAHYEINGQRTDEFPFPVLLDQAKPVVEYVPGWACDISAALIAHHHVILLGEVVHHAALALVAPVDTHDRAI